jgi:hypothetical protein
MAVTVDRTERVKIALCSFANISLERCSTDADFEIETVKEESSAVTLSMMLRMVSSGTFGTYVTVIVGESTVGFSATVIPAFRISSVMRFGHSGQCMPSILMETVLGAIAVD